MSHLSTDTHSIHQLEAHPSRLAVMKFNAVANKQRHRSRKVFRGLRRQMTRVKDAMGKGVRGAHGPSVASAIEYRLPSPISLGPTIDIHR